MIDKNLPRPTEAELRILQVLWKYGDNSVRKIFKILNQDSETEIGYSTVLKMLQIMTQKGLVVRDESERPQIYQASLPQEQTQRQLVNDLLDRAFGGSTRQLVMRALSAEETSEGDLAKIEKLLDKIEENKK